MTDESLAVRVAKRIGRNFSALSTTEYKKKPYYAHPTFYVKNLSEYVQLVTSIFSISKNDLFGKTLVFRGLADSEYDLSPGLARLKNITCDTEKELIDDFLTHRPEAFSGLEDFDILAKMQHYGLPTRLLDFTINPLIALYFACESKYSKSGRVLCHNTYLYNDTEPFISEICTAAIRKKFDDNYMIEEYLCNEKLTLHQYLSRVYLYGETTVVRPKYWNQRISNQAGLFMLFPNELYDRYMPVLVHSKKMGVSTAINEYGHRKIDENIIKEILEKEPIDYYKKEVSCYLSDKCFKKIDASHKSEKLEEQQWDKVKKFFENRFKISCDIKPLDTEIIKNNFCSIIVEPNYKKQILNELSYVGIGIDYIYPELEYTAKKIRRCYE